MVAVAKFTAVPTIAVWELLASIQAPGAGSVAALVAIAVILGGVFLYGKMKMAADTSERLLKLAQSEIEILNEKADRLEKRNVVLEARPSLEQHELLLRKLVERADEQTALLREIRAEQVRVDVA